MYHETVIRGPNYAKWIMIGFLALAAVLIGLTLAAGDADLFNWITAGAEADRVRAQILQDSQWFESTLPIRIQEEWDALAQRQFLRDDVQRKTAAATDLGIRVKQMVVLGGLGVALLALTVLALGATTSLVLTLWRWVDSRAPRVVAAPAQPVARPTTARPTTARPTTARPTTALALKRNGQPSPNRPGRPTPAPAPSANGRQPTPATDYRFLDRSNGGHAARGNYYSGNGNDNGNGNGNGNGHHGNGGVARPARTSRPERP